MPSSRRMPMHRFCRNQLICGTAIETNPLTCDMCNANKMETDDNNSRAILNTSALEKKLISQNWS